MYTITITEQDYSAIRFCGERYEFSAALSEYGPGVHTLQEHELWQILAAVENDTDNWRTSIPLLSEYSNLYRELIRLYKEVV